MYSARLKSDNHGQTNGLMLLGQNGANYWLFDRRIITVKIKDDNPVFYLVQPGLVAVGERKNLGTEQTHLKVVFGAHLRGTTAEQDFGPALNFCGVCHHQITIWFKLIKKPIA